MKKNLAIACLFICSFTKLFAQEKIEYKLCGQDFRAINMRSNLPKNAVYTNKNAAAEARAKDVISRLSFEEKLVLTGGWKQMHFPAVERLGLPPVYFSDASQGIHIKDICIKVRKSTAFPATIALAATWNPELAYNYAKSISEECRACMISYLDKQVGMIEDQLKKLGLDDNTIVIFCSDNGPAGSLGPNSNYFKSAGNLRGRKLDLYEGGIREPFIVKWPGKVAAGKVSDFASATYDMMETFAELLHVTAPENDGLSILPTLLGKDGQQKQRAYMYWEYPDKGGQLAVRMGNWKGVKTGLNKNPAAAWQVYNLETDEKESKDVIAEHPELITKFDAIVKKEHQTPVRPEWDLFNPNSKESTDNGE